MKQNMLINYLKSHPLLSLLRLLLVLLFFLLSGAAGFFLFFGPLNGGETEAILVGLVTGLLGASLMARQQAAKIRDEHSLARRLGLFHTCLSVVIFLGLGGLSLLQLSQTGALPASEDRAAGFEQLWKAIDANYPYFDLKQVDWDEIYDRYRPQIETAEDDESYYRLIASMLAELGDSHTGLTSSPLPPICGFARIEEMEGKAVVTFAGEIARKAGLEEGAVIIGVDGQPPEAARQALDPLYTSSSSPWKSRQRAFGNMLLTPIGESRKVSFETPGGELNQAELTCELQSGGSNQGENFSWARMPSGLGYIRIRTFGDNLVAQFDTALDELMDTPGLILDLRGNGGGNSMYADAMAGRLLDHTFVYGYDHFRQQLPQRGWRSWLYYRVKPRQPVYQGAVVLIIDTGCMSSAEQFIVSLVDSRRELSIGGRVQTVGRRTGGSSGNPISFNLPGGGQARFSTAFFTRLDGTPLEGVGITPDHEVYWTVDDFYQKRDPDLAKAEGVLAELTRCSDCSH